MGPLGHACHRIWDLGGGGGGVKNLFFGTWSCGISKGKSSKPGYTENFYPRIKLVTLGWGQRIKYHKISLRAWGFAMARQQMCSSYLYVFIV